MKIDDNTLLDDLELEGDSTDSEDWECVDSENSAIADPKPLVVDLGRIIAPATLTDAEKRRLKSLVLQAALCSRVTSLVFAQTCHLQTFESTAEAQCLSLFSDDSAATINGLYELFMEKIHNYKHCLMEQYKDSPSLLFEMLRGLPERVTGSSPFSSFLEHFGSFAPANLEKHYSNPTRGSRKRQKLSRVQIYSAIQARWLSLTKAHSSAAADQLSCWTAMLYYSLLRLCKIKCRFVASLRPLSVHAFATLAKTGSGYTGCLEKLQTERCFPCRFWVEIVTGDRVVCVDPCANSVKWVQDQPLKMDSGNSTCFVFAFTHPRCFFDCTKRYASDWSSIAVRQRQATAQFRRSWNALVSEHESRDASFAADKTSIEREWQQNLLRVPQTIHELKDHPVYVLERHLHYNQVIYPPDTKPIGYYNGREHIYLRKNASTLHSRRVWLEKRGLSVPATTTPALLVKGRAKEQPSLSAERNYGDNAIETIERESLLHICKDASDEQLLQLARRSKLSNFTAGNVREQTRSGHLKCLYGPWQTEPYVPDSWDSVVSNDSLRSVSILHPSMVPAGAAHVQGAPKLAELARKLNIPYKPAVTSFEFKSGRAYPVTNGIVVDKAFSSLLVDASREYSDHLSIKNDELAKARRQAKWIKMARFLLRKQLLFQKYL